MNTNRSGTRCGRLPGQAGFSLIELMVSLVLGLLVVGAAIGIFVSNKQAYRVTEGLGRVQENAQIAFELMSRDIRAAGANPCDAELVPGNIVDGGATASPTGSLWYAAVTQPLYGFESGGPTHEAGTDVLQVLRATDDIRRVTADMAFGSSTVSYAPGTPAFGNKDLLMICDMQALGVFRANGASGGSASSGTVSFAAGSGINQCAYFPQPNAGICAGAGTAYLFPKSSTISRMQGVRWFVRDPDGDATNGASLYRQVDDNTAEEVVQGVSDLELQYLGGAGYVDASALTTVDAWNEIRAVRMTLTLRETGTTGTDGSTSQPITRTVESVATIRNRLL